MSGSRAQSRSRTRCCRHTRWSRCRRNDSTRRAEPRLPPGLPNPSRSSPESSRCKRSATISTRSAIGAARRSEVTSAACTARLWTRSRSSRAKATTTSSTRGAMTAAIWMHSSTGLGRRLPPCPATAPSNRRRSGSRSAMPTPGAQAPATPGARRTGTRALARGSRRARPRVVGVRRCMRFDARHLRAPQAGRRRHAEAATGQEHRTRLSGSDRCPAHPAGLHDRPAEDAAHDELNLVAYYRNAPERIATRALRAADRAAAAWLPERDFHLWVAGGLPGLYLADGKVSAATGGHSIGARRRRSVEPTCLRRVSRALCYMVPMVKPSSPLLSSTATRSRTARTTRCRSRSAARTAGRRGSSQASATCSCGCGKESPRAVVVAWDTLDRAHLPTRLKSYQSGREFAPDLLEQLDLAPQLCEAMGFAVAKADGYEADDFLAAAVA